MGRLLAIDTSSRYAAIALAAYPDSGPPHPAGQQDCSVAAARWYSENNHGAELMPALLRLLDRAGVTMDDLTAVAIAIGPGGFSALRVGLATAQGIALARGLPLLPVSTFEIEALPFDRAEGDLYAVTDAGSRGLAWGRFGAPAEGRRTLADRGVATPAELVAAAGGDAVFCGEGAGKLAGLIPAGRVLSGEPPTRDPDALVRLALAALAAGGGVDASEVEPFYARPPSTTVPRPPAAPRGRRGR